MVMVVGVGVSEGEGKERRERRGGGRTEEEPSDLHRMRDGLYVRLQD